MEAVLMRQAAATRRCAGEAKLAGTGSKRGVARLGLARRGKGAVRARLPAARAHLAVERSNEVVGDEEEGEVRLFVGLPSDVVTEGHAVSRAKAVSTGLRALRLLGVDGVELPLSWAVVQPGSGDEFEWAGYLAVADMVRDAGLCLRVSLHTDGPALPAWVADAAAADADILFTDRSGTRREGCLSFAVDELPVLDGSSPIEAYEAFFRSFADAFKQFLGSTITDVTVSLGPNGELRFPSYPPGSDGEDGYTGVGEFQCYDKHMLAWLKRHAEASGQPLWGLSGPHDAPRYGESPESSGFFRGSSETAYGGFFLSWYAGELLAHGDRVLAAAARAFGGEPVELSAKVPLLRSRPAEATAGLHGGYGPVAEMFARHACTVIASGMDVARRGGAVGSSAEDVLAQIKAACTQHGTRFAGESTSLAVAREGGGDGSPGAWGRMLVAERTRPSQFTYQRMGAEFFAPEHWSLFVQLVRALECPEEAHGDDLATASDGSALAVPSSGRAAHGALLKEEQTV